MIKNFHNFIKDLQEASDRKKRLWLWIFSGTTIMVVVAIWGVYMNGVILSVYPTTVPQVVVKKEAVRDSSLATNVSSIGGVLKNTIKTFGEELKNIYNTATISRTFMIKKNKPNFTLENMEKVTQKKLP